MANAENSVLVQYEFDAYIFLSNINLVYEVCDVQLTEDEASLSGHKNESNWIKVERVIVHTTEDIKINNTLKKMRRRICGLFDAEPYDWKYVKISIRERNSGSYYHVITKMPISPVTPVLFILEANDL